ncbi:hypothetical protein CAPTEDRAFT_198213 [Capitella teleta]|uniref:Protein sleepless n=1 Tax=Capitella teleta TaxID=283909 RepID=R7T8M5_CAPTE|nr:hypothetical protein CAPTEDRAFT_198213 [Capitella teleta]|eukprot:ELT89990.1 hypothetical protein CAPTEDRAFT_198213 [Capitella teleta]
MDSSRVALALFAAFCVLSYYGADSLHCYVCNNHKDYQGKECDAPEEHEDTLLKNCADEGIINKMNYTMCRKMVQEVEGETRVVRTCATHGKPGSCVERTGTKQVRVEYCECEGDKCNSGTHNAPQVILSTCVALVVAIKALL